MFTEDDLNQSIEELNNIKKELEQIDALYEQVKSQIPEDVINAGARDLPHNEIVDKMVAEAIKKAEAEGRQRAASYADSHPAANNQKVSSPASGRRRGGLMI